MSDYLNRVFNHSCETMSEIPDGAIHCVVTSPPYYGLRDYGTARWVGGESNCRHEVTNADRTPWANEVRGPNGRNKNPPASTRPKEVGGECSRCGAVRVDEQIGLELTVDEYIDRIVRVFSEVHRVLRDNGIAFLNLGDSYFGDSPPRKASSESFSDEWDKSLTRSRGGTRRSARSYGGLKPKDLMLVPHRVAIALQEAGWWVRDDIVWHKPNPMPSPVSDRCTPAKEYVFMLAKSRRYYANMEAVKEPLSEESIKRLSQPSFDAQTGGDKDHANGVNHRTSMRRTLENLKRKQDELVGVNLRNVWTIATEPYAGAHFATMPRELARRCILIGSPPGGIVLDPFMGSGTVAEVATGCGRRYVGYELNPEYIDLIRDRLGLFGENAV